MNIEYIVSSLGFESRALNSLKRILNYVKPKEIMFIKYPEEGKTKEILNLVYQKNIQFTPFTYFTTMEDKGIELANEQAIGLPNREQTLRRRIVRSLPSGV